MVLSITQKSIKSGLKKRIWGTELAKITIERESTKEGVQYEDIFAEDPDVLFNPNQINLTKTNQWNREPQTSSSSGALQFVGGDPKSYTIDLFFNTYEDLSSGQSGGKIKQGVLKSIKDYATPSLAFSFLEESAVSVKPYTEKVWDLIEIDKTLTRPPRCKLSWGAFGKIIVGFVTEISELFTLFLPDGTPVRATLTCTFEEEDPDKEKKFGTKAIDDDPVRIVRRGETLSSIAYQEYDDPSLWREIARINGIDNPRNLQPGQRLVIPVLRPQ
ncbi:MAG: LysM peptidoglycan-binding domain-containing protein [Hormoscilla sp. GUM202]|nr:LysM peptidoglycan-binding domain-containing protein [Hormoscilla sp. GUM202]